MCAAQNQRTHRILGILEAELDLSNVRKLDSDSFNSSNYDCQLAQEFPNIYDWYLQLRAVRTIETHNVLTRLTTASPFIIEKSRNNVGYTPGQVDRFQCQACEVPIPELPVCLRNLSTEIYLKIYDYQHYLSGIGNQTVLGFSSGAGKLARTLDVGLSRYVGFDVKYAISFDLRAGMAHWYDFSDWDNNELLEIMSLHDVQVGSYHSYL